MTNVSVQQALGAQAPVESHQQGEVDALQAELRQHAAAVRHGWAFAESTADVKMEKLRFGAVRARVVADDYDL